MVDAAVVVVVVEVVVLVVMVMVVVVVAEIRNVLVKIYPFCCCEACMGSNNFGPNRTFVSYDKHC